MYSKQEIWQELIRLETKAILSAQGKTGVLLISEPKGHTALEILNQQMHKNPHTRLKRYTEQDLQITTEILKAPTFLETLTQSYIQETSSPEMELRKLKLLQQMGQAVEIPGELINKVKQDKPTRVVKLWNQLEKMEIEVCEIYPAGRNTFDFKIRTPLHTYLSTATAEEILAIAKKDIEFFRNSKCPYCHVPIDYEQHNIAGWFQCSSCGSLCGSIAENLAKILCQEIFEKLGTRGIYTVLKQFYNLYFLDPETQYSWFFFPLIVLKMESVVLPTVLGPETVQQGNDLEIPLFVNTWEHEKEPDSEENAFLATCSFCVHCALLKPPEDAFFATPKPICVYPHHSHFFEEQEIEPPLILDWEEAEETEKFWKVFMDQYLESLTVVEWQTRDLEVFIPEKNFFHGPICPRFTLNQEHPDLDPENDCLVILEKKGVGKFGIINLTAIREEKEKAEQEKWVHRTIPQIQEKMKRLQEGHPEIEKILKLRVETGKKFHFSRNQLASFLAQHLTRSELLLMMDHGNFLSLNTSHKAYLRVIELALQKMS